MIRFAQHSGPTTSTTKPHTKAPKPEAGIKTQLDDAGQYASPTATIALGEPLELTGDVAPKVKAKRSGAAVAGRKATSSKAKKQQQDGVAVKDGGAGEVDLLLGLEG